MTCVRANAEAKRPTATVAAPSNGFHKAGTLDGVAEGLTDFADRFVETVVEIHESVRGPELFLEFLTSYDIAGVLKQQG